MRRSQSPPTSASTLLISTAESPVLAAKLIPSKTPTPQWGPEAFKDAMLDWKIGGLFYLIQDHSLLHSFGLKQLLHSGNNGLGFEGNAGLEVVDQCLGSDPTASLLVLVIVARFQVCS
ncbi:hypothetical protein V6N13_087949 [Hibiscus sabdariffa]|uniref:Uncharacterized protein n=1 Tax=Hibiscus sabdariffa TaxID=183260 RepID=A0ABR2FXZ2_9ROSI